MNSEAQLSHRREAACTVVLIFKQILRGKAYGFQGCRFTGESRCGSFKYKEVTALNNGVGFDELGVKPGLYIKYGFFALAGGCAFSHLSMHSFCLHLDPEWASYKLGIFICLNCSGIHRNLPQISRVKSLRLDFWENDLIEVQKEKE